MRSDDEEVTTTEEWEDTEEDDDDDDAMDEMLLDLSNRAARMIASSSLLLPFSGTTITGVGLRETSGVTLAERGRVLLLRCCCFCVMLVSRSGAIPVAAEMREEDVWKEEREHVVDVVALVEEEG